jgi:hypothetical protein
MILNDVEFFEKLKSKLVAAITGFEEKKTEVVIEVVEKQPDIFNQPTE